MLSASENPPVVYLQNLTLKTPALQLHPSASSSAVVAASFHPQRPNVFLLAFRDGTLAAYDATQMAERNGARMDVNATLETDGGTGEISHLSSLHRVTNRGTESLNVAALGGYDQDTRTAAVGSKSVGITGAAFLPGYRTRALSVGGDGRCRLVDFEAGGKILRTWHAQAPVTSLSVLAIKGTRTANVANMDGIGAPERRKRGGTVIGGPTGTNNIIAVGRADGKVCLFDSVGMKLDMIVVDEDGNRVISVEWIKGPTPKAMPSISNRKTADETEVDQRRTVRLTVQSEKPLRYEEPSSALPSAMKGSILRSLAKTSATLKEPAMTGALPMDDFSTVRHIPAAALSSQAHGVSPAVGGNYLDLFSPVKQSAPPLKQSPRRVADSNPRVLFRPRLSSQTFSPEASVEPEPGQAHQLAIHPLGASITDPKKLVTATPPKLPSKSHLRQNELASARKVAEDRLKREFGCKPPSSSDSMSRTPRFPSAVVRNGQLLADLRKLGGKDGHRKARRKSSNVALFAPYMNRTGISDLPRTVRIHPDNAQPGRATAEELPSEWEKTTAMPNEEHLLDSESHSSDRDIWLTATTLSEDEASRKHLHRRHQRRHKERELATSARLNNHDHQNRQGSPPFPPDTQELDVRPGATSTSFRIVSSVPATKIVPQHSPDAPEQQLKPTVTRYDTALEVQPTQSGCIKPAHQTEPIEAATEARKAVALGRIHSPKATRPWIAQKVLETTSDEGMITAKEYFSPVDAATSPNPQTQESATTPKEKKVTIAMQSREKLGLVQHNAANGRKNPVVDPERQNAATAAAFALLGAVKSHPVVEASSGPKDPVVPATYPRALFGLKPKTKPVTSAVVASTQSQPQQQQKLNRKKDDKALLHGDGQTTTKAQSRTQRAQVKERERKRLGRIVGVDGEFGIHEDCTAEDCEDEHDQQEECVNEGETVAGDKRKRRECNGCPALKKQVRELNDEVARLRAEVLGLKRRVRLVGA